MKKAIICIIILSILAGFGYYCYTVYQEKQTAEQTPTITLMGDEHMELTLGEHYYEPGVIARDYMGNDITEKVEYSRTDIRDAGEYEIEYSVTDNDNTATVKRTVTVSYAEPDPESETYGHGIAVFMYHYVYDPADPPENLNSNYISADALEEQLQYLTDNDYYFPTWQEIRDYVDGKIELPVKSVVLTFDDCTKQFIQNGIPLLEEYDVRATSFVICINNGEEMAKTDYKHVNFQSHSYDMHKPGGSIGHGGIFTALSYDDALADLNRSIEILGSNEAFAYPFGDYTDTCRQAVEDAGFLVAFTTVNGKVYPGNDPMFLSRVRVEGYITLDEYISYL